MPFMSPPLSGAGRERFLRTCNCDVFLKQILNRTNNIFELVTVQPVLSNRPTDRNVILSDEIYFSPEENKLRLKGTDNSGDFGRTEQSIKRTATADE